MGELWERALHVLKESIDTGKVDAETVVGQLTDVILQPDSFEYDSVHRPEHYLTGGIETIDYIEAKLGPIQFEGYCIGNALKYVSRYRYKGGREDLQKAVWYIQRLIGKER